MMMHTTQALYDNLNSILTEINSQIEAVRDDTWKQIGVLPYPEGLTPYQIKSRDGKFVLTDLLTAKAQIVSAMANLKAADMASKTPKPRR